MLQKDTRHEGLVLTISDHEAGHTWYLNIQDMFYEHSNNILKQIQDLYWEVTVSSGKSAEKGQTQSPVCAHDLNQQQR